MMGEIEPNGNLNANIIHQFTKSLRCKFISQVWYQTVACLYTAFGLCLTVSVWCVRQDVHARVPLSRSSIIWHWPNTSCILWLGRHAWWKLMAAYGPGLSTLRWAVLTVLWIGFVTLGQFHCAWIFLCLSVCILCVFVSYCIVVVLLWAQWTWRDWSLILWTYLPSVFWHCWLGYLTRKNPSLIQSIMCLVGR